ncbi:MAG: ATP-binding cassette domain-containing protein, partial [Oscillospiraceae bacterium]
KRVLERFDMGNMGEQNVLNLSRGEKQRLAICALLLCEPKILILDEPTSGLDEEAAEKLSLTIEKLVASGTGVVLISHDERFVARHANRVLKVSEGSVYEQ